MSNYMGWIITNKGRELLARAINNETKINITKFKTGSGYNTGNDRTLINLLQPLNEFPVNAFERKENGNVEFTFIVSNKSSEGESLINRAYKISEMGIFAQDDEGNEVMYAYNKGTDGDYIPVYNGKNAIDIIEKCIIVIDQAATINVTIDSSMTYVTRSVLETELSKKVNKTDKASSAAFGVTKYGTEENTSLEGNKLAQIIGADVAGNIQDSGTKTVGKIYFDKISNYYFKCIQATTDTYVSASKFVAISNNQLSERLENLFKNSIIKSSDNYGIKIYYKPTSLGNYIDVSDTFSNVEFALLTSWKSYEDNSNISYILQYQKFENGKIIFNSRSFISSNNSTTLTQTINNYSNSVDNSKNYGSCIALVYGTLKS